MEEPIVVVYKILSLCYVTTNEERTLAEIILLIDK